MPAGQAEGHKKLDARGWGVVVVEASIRERARHKKKSQAMGIARQW